MPLCILGTPSQRHYNNVLTRFTFLHSSTQGIPAATNTPAATMTTTSLGPCARERAPRPTGRERGRRVVLKTGWCRRGHRQRYAVPFHPRTPSQRYYDTILIRLSILPSSRQGILAAASSSAAPMTTTVSETTIHEPGIAHTAPKCTAAAVNDPESMKEAVGDISR